MARVEVDDSIEGIYFRCWKEPELDFRHSVCKVIKVLQSVENHSYVDVSSVTAVWSRQPNDAISGLGDRLWAVGRFDVIFEVVG